MRSRIAKQIIKEIPLRVSLFVRVYGDVIVFLNRVKRFFTPKYGLPKFENPPPPPPLKKER